MNIDPKKFLKQIVVDSPQFETRAPLDGMEMPLVGIIRIDGVVYRFIDREGSNVLLRELTVGELTIIQQWLKKFV